MWVLASFCVVALTVDLVVVVVVVVARLFELVVVHFLRARIWQNKVPHKAKQKQGRCQQSGLFLDCFPLSLFGGKEIEGGGIPRTD